MSALGIGCCGAVCKTCIPYKNNICRGCKIGYEKGERDIKRAKCRNELPRRKQRGITKNFDYELRKRRGIKPVGSVKRPQQIFSSMTNGGLFTDRLNEEYFQQYNIDLEDK
jgi:hypothetical protein